MGITFVINPGSTSKTYAFYSGRECLYSVRYERTEDGFACCRVKHNAPAVCESVAPLIYQDALADALTRAEAEGVAESPAAITAVGVRVVAPGEPFAKHSKITEEYLGDLAKQETVAPLHVPPILAEIKAAQAACPNATLYAVSDSAFHQSIPVHRRKIAFPASDTEDFDLKRFGYHGLSVGSIARRTEDFFGVAPDRVIVLHFGGGVSATALHYQESVDTSMGYSPSSGILMSSRVGNCDADALIALMTKKGLRDTKKLCAYLNEEAGFKGLTGYGDLRLVLDAFANDDPAAVEAMEMFRYQLQRQVGGHIALLGELDAFVFTGTAAVRNPFLRQFVLEGLSSFGLFLDTDRNDALVGHSGMIHSDRSDVSIGVMESDEMGEIARVVTRLSEDQ
ncbi:hypothetical protein N9L26_00690 [Candidatus Pacebacteria bacterium]|nr:hypothetical protein [Candidatus Paceibacterota bacterium]